MFLNNTGHNFQGPTIWDYLTLEEEPKIFQNTGQQLPTYSIQHPRKMKTSMYTAASEELPAFIH
jgi:hypothetical protein